MTKLVERAIKPAINPSENEIFIVRGAGVNFFCFVFHLRNSLIEMLACTLQIGFLLCNVKCVLWKPVKLLISNIFALLSLKCSVLKAPCSQQFSMNYLIIRCRCQLVTTITSFFMIMIYGF